MAAPAPKELPLDPKYDEVLDYPTNAPTPQNGHPGFTTPEQDAQVFQLRSLLEQAGYTKGLDTLTMVGFPGGKHTTITSVTVRSKMLMVWACS